MVGLFGIGRDHLLPKLEWIFCNRNINIEWMLKHERIPAMNRSDWINVRSFQQVGLISKQWIFVARDTEEHVVQLPNHIICGQRIVSDLGCHKCLFRSSRCGTPSWRTVPYRSQIDHSVFRVVFNGCVWSFVQQAITTIGLLNLND